ncbi:dipeptidase [Hydrogenophaga sp.]|jgi:membrane dipeptidase|uniref:dipeptidase n=1 Tax=Hydrogenophaga sp. TaxID=1904254 RepID=UPI003F71960B
MTASVNTGSSAAQKLLQSSIVIDTLGGAVVHPTPHVAQGTYEENMVAAGWSVLHACLVSEPSYSPSFHNLLTAVYENLLNFEMSPKVRHIETVDDIYEAKKNGQLGVIFGVQNSTWIEQERERIRLLYKLGLRTLQLTYMERNWIGDGCLEPENRGLTNFGMQVVRECNRLGIVIDCSHVGIQTTLDAVKCSKQPIVISHTAVRAITDNPRCVTDEQMKAVADKGGTIGITTFSPFIRSDRQPTLDDYLDHFDYAINLIGEDHVTFATDWFDGKTKVNWATPWYYPEVTQGKQYEGLGLVGFAVRAELINVVERMLQRGYGPERIRKLLGDNFIRVLKEVWK